jgi:hypothetical protein
MLAVWIAAITFAALSLSTVGASADGTVRPDIAQMDRSRNSTRRPDHPHAHTVQATAACASAIHSRLARPAPHTATPRCRESAIITARDDFRVASV